MSVTGSFWVLWLRAHRSQQDRAELSRQQRCVSQSSFYPSHIHAKAQIKIPKTERAHSLKYESTHSPSLARARMHAQTFVRQNVKIKYRPEEPEGSTGVEVHRAANGRNEYQEQSGHIQRIVGGQCSGQAEEQNVCCQWNRKG